MTGYGPNVGGPTLTRRAGEEIILNQGTDSETVIVVEAAAGGRAQLRIIAPRHVTIDRAETRFSPQERTDR